MKTEQQRLGVQKKRAYQECNNGIQKPSVSKQQDKAQNHQEQKNLNMFVFSSQYKNFLVDDNIDHVTMS